MHHTVIGGLLARVRLTGAFLLSHLPQVVVDRMFSRVLVCAGLPVATGVLLFPLFWYLKVSSWGQPAPGIPSTQGLRQRERS
jgi:hypothetical protein